MSTVDDLRSRALTLRAMAEEARVDKARLASEMMRDMSSNAHQALKLEAAVADCMSRRYAQWATVLEEAAYELENP